MRNCSNALRLGVARLLIGAGVLLFTTGAAQSGCNTTYHADLDGDLHGDPANTTTGGATPPPGYVTDSTDCDDADATVYTGAAEVPYDGIDQNCDGHDLVDADGDGIVGVGAGGADCDDTDATVYPGARSEQAGISMAYLCGGSFLMGSSETEVGREANETQHSVTLTHAFYAGITEVTQSQFQGRMGYNPSVFTSCGGSCPVENVSWHEAAAFTNALSTADGLPACYACTGSGTSVSCTPPASSYQCAGYRLPTEAEWEYLARAGQPTAFPNGGGLQEQGISNCKGNLMLYDAAQEPVGTLDGLAWYCGDDRPDGTKAVGQLEPNDWGLFDVSGNVYEWCNDYYGEYTGDAEVDPAGPTSGSTRIDRGAGFYDEPEYQRSAYRSDFPPGGRANLLGLRVVRSLP